MHFTPPFLNNEFKLKASRSGGKGGQNVNKTSTKVLLEFAVHDSLLLNDEEKNTLLVKLADKLTKDGIIQVVSQTGRTQLINKEIALKKIYALLNKCFVVRKKRKATKPSRSVKENRLKEKKKASEIKKGRSRKSLRADD